MIIVCSEMLRKWWFVPRKRRIQTEIMVYIMSVLEIDYEIIVCSEMLRKWRFVTRKRSYRGKMRRTLTSSKTERDAGGNLKWGPMVWSMVEPSSTEKVSICDNAVHTTIVLTQMGKNRSSIFTSSTCVTVHSRHGLTPPSFKPSATAALSRNLRTDIHPLISLEFFENRRNQCSGEKVLNPKPYYLPKLVGVCKDFHWALALSGAFVQDLVVGDVCLVFSRCSNQDLEDGRQRASERHLVPVQGRPAEEHDDCEDHHRCWNSESPSEADIVLHGRRDG
jgi:hypothetical protein